MTGIFRGPPLLFLKRRSTTRTHEVLAEPSGQWPSVSSSSYSFFDFSFCSHSISASASSFGQNKLRPKSWRRSRFDQEEVQSPVQGNHGKPCPGNELNLRILMMSHSMTQRQLDFMYYSSCIVTLLLCVFYLFSYHICITAKIKHQSLC